MRFALQAHICVFRMAGRLGKCVSKGYYKSLNDFSTTKKNKIAINITMFIKLVKCTRIFGCIVALFHSNAHLKISTHSVHEGSL